MSSVADAPPVRTGTARLMLAINGEVYIVRRVARLDRPAGCAVAWRLKKATGERSGAVYVVAKVRGVIECSCADVRYNHAACKHQRALVAAGLVSARKRRPSEGGDR